jgi:hypothetical protein
MADDEAYCRKCDKTIADHHLVSTIDRIDSCPHCGTVIRTEKGHQGANIAAQNVSDIAAIDEWLDERKPEKRDDAYGAAIWTVKMAHEGTCEVHYERRRPGGFRIALTRIGPIPKLLEFVCACHGVQFCQSRNLTDLARSRWGASQILGTVSLLPELFDAVLKRLNEAVAASQPSDSNHAGAGTSD